MRGYHVATGLLFIGSLSAIPGAAMAASAGDITLFFGQRDLEDKDFIKPLDLDKQFAFGLGFTSGSTDLPIFFDAGLHGSTDDSSFSFADQGDGVSGTFKFDMTLSEIYAGALLAPMHGQVVSPYLGVGATFIRAKLEVDADLVGEESGSDSADDTSMGFYVRTGLNFTIGSSFMLGADVRYVGGTKLKFDDGEDELKFDADYLQYGLTIGYRWGGDASASSPSSRTIMPLPHGAAPLQVVPPITPAPAPEAASPPPAAPVAAPRTPPSTSNVVAEAIALRDQPHVESTGPVLVPAGSTIERLRVVPNVEGRWHYVRYGREEGWIPESALR